MSENDGQGQTAEIMDDLDEILGPDETDLDGDFDAEGEPEPEPESNGDGDGDGDGGADDPKPAAASAGDPDGTRMVPIAALHEARQTARELREELARRPAAAAPAPEPEPQGDDLDDDTIVTGAQVKQLINKATAGVRQETRQEALLRAEANAREILSATTMGAGLDYDSVTNTGKENLSNRDIQKIMAAADPAREAYKLCIQRTPELAAKARVARAARSSAGGSKTPQNKPPIDIEEPIPTMSQVTSAADEVFAHLMG